MVSYKKKGLTSLNYLLLSTALASTWVNTATAQEAAVSVAKDTENASIQKPDLNAKKWFPQANLDLAAGSVRSIAQPGIMAPLVQTDDSMIFFDVRGMLDSRREREGNAGLGFSKLMPEGFIWRTYGFYDRRMTKTNKTVQQITVGGDILTENYDFRANVYLPITRPIKTQHASSTMKRNQVHSEFVTYKDQHYIEVPMGGFDAEVGRQVPGVEGLRLFGGFYHFAGKDVDPINGVRVRGEYPLTSWLAVKVEGQYDKVRGSQGFLGMRMRYALGAPDKSDSRLTTLEKRMMTPIERDVDAVVGKSKKPKVTREQTKDTGKVILHYIDDPRAVGAAPGAGTFESPINLAHPQGPLALQALSQDPKFTVLNHKVQGEQWVRGQHRHPLTTAVRNIPTVAQYVQTQAQALRHAQQRQANRQAGNRTGRGMGPVGGAQVNPQTVTQTPLFRRNRASAVPPLQMPFGSSANAPLLTPPTPPAAAPIVPPKVGLPGLFGHQSGRQGGATGGGAQPQSQQPFANPNPQNNGATGVPTGPQQPGFTGQQPPHARGHNLDPNFGQGGGAGRGPRDDDSNHSPRGPGFAGGRMGMPVRVLRDDIGSQPSDWGMDDVSVQTPVHVPVQPIARQVSFVPAPVSTDVPVNVLAAAPASAQQRVTAPVVPSPQHTSPVRQSPNSAFTAVQPGSPETSPQRPQTSPQSQQPVVVVPPLNLSAIQNAAAGVSAPNATSLSTEPLFQPIVPASSAVPPAQNPSPADSAASVVVDRSVAQQAALSQPLGSSMPAAGATVSVVSPASQPVETDNIEPLSARDPVVVAEEKAKLMQRAGLRATTASTTSQVSEDETSTIVPVAIPAPVRPTEPAAKTDVSATTSSSSAVAPVIGEDAATSASQNRVRTRTPSPVPQPASQPPVSVENPVAPVVNVVSASSSAASANAVAARQQSQEVDTTITSAIPPVSALSVPDHAASTSSNDVATDPVAQKRGHERESSQELEHNASVTGAHSRASSMDNVDLTQPAAQFDVPALASAKPIAPVASSQSQSQSYPQPMAAVEPVSTAASSTVLAGRAPSTFQVTSPSPAAQQQQADGSEMEVSLTSDSGRTTPLSARSRSEVEAATAQLRQRIGARMTGAASTTSQVSEASSEAPENEDVFVPVSPSVSVVTPATTRTPVSTRNMSATSPSSSVSAAPVQPQSTDVERTAAASVISIVQSAMAGISDVPSASPVAPHVEPVAVDTVASAPQGSVTFSVQAPVSNEAPLIQVVIDTAQLASSVALPSASVVSHDAPAVIPSVAAASSELVVERRAAQKPRHERSNSLESKSNKASSSASAHLRASSLDDVDPTVAGVVFFRPDPVGVKPVVLATDTTSSHVSSVSAVVPTTPAAATSTTTHVSPPKSSPAPASASKHTRSLSDEVSTSASASTAKDHATTKHPLSVSSQASSSTYEESEERDAEVVVAATTTTVTPLVSRHHNDTPALSGGTLTINDMPLPLEDAHETSSATTHSLPERRPLPLLDAVKAGAPIPSGAGPESARSDASVVVHSDTEDEDDTTHAHTAAIFPAAVAPVPTPQRAAPTSPQTQPSIAPATPLRDGSSLSVQGHVDMTDSASNRSSSSSRASTTPSSASHRRRASMSDMLESTTVRQAATSDSDSQASDDRVHQPVELGTPPVTTQQPPVRPASTKSNVSDDSAASFTPAPPLKRSTSASHLEDAVASSSNKPVDLPSSRVSIASSDSAADFEPVTTGQPVPAPASVAAEFVAPIVASTLPAPTAAAQHRDADDDSYTSGEDSEFDEPERPRSGPLNLDVSFDRDGDKSESLPSTRAMNAAPKPVLVSDFPVAPAVSLTDVSFGDNEEVEEDIEEAEASSTDGSSSGYTDDEFDEDTSGDEQPAPEVTLTPAQQRNQRVRELESSSSEDEEEAAPPFAGRPAAAALPALDDVSSDDDDAHTPVKPVTRSALKKKSTPAADDEHAAGYDGGDDDDDTDPTGSGGNRNASTSTSTTVPTTTSTAGSSSATQKSNAASGRQQVLQNKTASTAQQPAGRSWADVAAGRSAVLETTGAGETAFFDIDGVPGSVDAPASMATPPSARSAKPVSTGHSRHTSLDDSTLPSHLATVPTKPGSIASSYTSESDDASSATHSSQGDFVGENPVTPTTPGPLTSHTSAPNNTPARPANASTDSGLPITPGFLEKFLGNPPAAASKTGEEEQLPVFEEADSDDENETLNFMLAGAKPIVWTAQQPKSSPLKPEITDFWDDPVVAQDDDGRDTDSMDSSASVPATATITTTSTAQAVVADDAAQADDSDTDSVDSSASVSATATTKATTALPPHIDGDDAAEEQVDGVEERQVSPPLHVDELHTDITPPAAAPVFAKPRELTPDTPLADLTNQPPADPMALRDVAVSAGYQGVAADLYVLIAQKPEDGFYRTAERVQKDVDVVIAMAHGAWGECMEATGGTLDPAMKDDFVQEFLSRTTQKLHLNKGLGDSSSTGTASTATVKYAGLMKAAKRVLDARVKSLAAQATAQQRRQQAEARALADKEAAQQRRRADARANLDALQSVEEVTDKDQLWVNWDHVWFQSPAPSNSVADSATSTKRAMSGFSEGSDGSPQFMSPGAFLSVLEALEGSEESDTTISTRPSDDATASVSSPTPKKSKEDELWADLEERRKELQPIIDLLNGAQQRTPAKTVVDPVMPDTDPLKTPELPTDLKHYFVRPVLENADPVEGVPVDRRLDYSSAMTPQGHPTPEQQWKVGQPTPDQFRQIVAAWNMLVPTDSSMWKSPETPGSQGTTSGRFNGLNSGDGSRMFDDGDDDSMAVFLSAEAAARAASQPTSARDVPATPQRSGGPSAFATPGTGRSGTSSVPSTPGSVPAKSEALRVMPPIDTAKARRPSRPGSRAVTPTVDAMSPRLQPSPRALLLAQHEIDGKPVTIGSDSVTVLSPRAGNVPPALPAVPQQLNGRPTEASLADHRQAAQLVQAVRKIVEEDPRTAERLVASLRRRSSVSETLDTSGRHSAPLETMEGDDAVPNTLSPLSVGNSPRGKKDAALTGAERPATPPVPPHMEELLRRVKLTPRGGAVLPEVPTQTGPESEQPEAAAEKNQSGSHDSGSMGSGGSQDSAALNPRPRTGKKGSTTVRTPRDDTSRPRSASPMDQSMISGTSSMTPEERAAHQASVTAARRQKEREEKQRQKDLQAKAREEQLAKDAAANAAALESRAADKERKRQVQERRRLEKEAKEAAELQARDESIQRTREAARQKVEFEARRSALAAATGVAAQQLSRQGVTLDPKAFGEVGAVDKIKLLTNAFKPLWEMQPTDPGYDKAQRQLSELRKDPILQGIEKIHRSKPEGAYRLDVPQGADEKLDAFHRIFLEGQPVRYLDSSGNALEPVAFDAASRSVVTSSATVHPDSAGSSSSTTAAAAARTGSRIPTPPVTRSDSGRSTPVEDRLTPVEGEKKSKKAEQPTLLPRFSAKSTAAASASGTITSDMLGGQRAASTVASAAGNAAKPTLLRRPKTTAASSSALNLRTFIPETDLDDEYGSGSVQNQKKKFAASTVASSAALSMEPTTRAFLNPADTQTVSGTSVPGTPVGRGRGRGMQPQTPPKSAPVSLKRVVDSLPHQEVVPGRSPAPIAADVSTLQKKREREKLESDQEAERVRQVQERIRQAQQQGTQQLPVSRNGTGPYKKK